MQPRPRRYENKIADILSERFVAMGLSPVQRIPVNGRRGPDLTINELGLVIDCKTRKEVPRSILVRKPTCFRGVYVAAPIVHFPQIEPEVAVDFYSEVVLGYLNHIAEICSENQIPMIVLNKPNLWVSKSVFVIPSQYLEVFNDRIKRNRTA
ncbi:MAG: hypothetical protein QXS54_11265 [Candidatus Methanomethylicaceae archaeon]